MKKLLIMVAGSALLVAGCKPSTPSPGPTNKTVTNPVACFSVNKTLIDSGETIITTNCSTNATSYQWDFGLGATSIFTAFNASYTFTNFKRGTAYNLELDAFGATGTISGKKDTIITVGYRRIDSIILVKVPGHTLNDSTIFIQLINRGATTTSPQISPPGLPCTFRMNNATPAPIVIDHANNNNDGAWVGKVVVPSVSGGSPNVETFGTNPAEPVYFSRGLGINPIKITDGSGFELDVYYSIIPKD